MIRAIIQFRASDGNYRSLSRTRPADQSFHAEDLPWVLSALPMGSTLVSLKFEALALTPEDIILHRTTASSDGDIPASH